jgi:site-specific DNA-adenine methylase
MDSDQTKVKEYILFQINRNIISLYKRYLNVIEDLQEEHINMLNKLNKLVSTKDLENIDYFDENRYNYIRKRILDLGNETIREIEKNLSYLELKIKT